MIHRASDRARRVAPPRARTEADHRSREGPEPVFARRRLERGRRHHRNVRCTTASSLSSPRATPRPYSRFVSRATPGSPSWAAVVRHSVFRGRFERGQGDRRCRPGRGHRNPPVDLGPRGDGAACGERPSGMCPRRHAAPVHRVEARAPVPQCRAPNVV